MGSSTQLAAPILVESSRPAASARLRTAVPAHAPHDIYQLLEACSPHISVNQGPLFRASLDTDRVSILTRSLGPELYAIARQVFCPDAVSEDPGSERDSKPPTPENRLRQFIYLYEQRTSAPAAEPAAE